MTKGPFYVDLINYDPMDDCRGIWTEDMIRRAIDGINGMYQLIELVNTSKSTAERMEALRKIKEFRVGHGLSAASVLADTLEEQLNQMVGTV